VKAFRAQYFLGALVLGDVARGSVFWPRREGNVRAKWLMHATVPSPAVVLGLLLYDKFSGNLFLECSTGPGPGQAGICKRGARTRPG